MRIAKQNKKNSSGSALIVVLWVTGLLAMLTASLAFEAHLEARITNYYRNRVLAYYSARSGVTVAELLISRIAGLPRTEFDAAVSEQDRWYEYTWRLANGNRVSFAHDVPMESGIIATNELVITTTQDRFNARTLGSTQSAQNDELFERILEAGGIPESLWPTLIDSYYDWVEEGDEPRPDGAKSDYYMSLDPPYRAANAPVGSVGELLLIRGFNHAILYGGTLTYGIRGEEEREIRGIADFLTTYGDGKIDINAAPRRILMLLPGMDEVLAGAILELRDERAESTGGPQQGYRSLSEFYADFSDFPEESRDMITVTPTYFRIESVGVLYGVRHAIWCTVEHSDGRIRILEWREDD